MKNENRKTEKSEIFNPKMFRCFPRSTFCFSFISLCVFTSLVFTTVYSQTQPTFTTEQDKIIIEDAGENETFALGKTIVIRGKAKEVLALGGDVIVEGEVSGDVATIGGSIYQGKDAFIGGDVIVFGGTYKSDVKEPKRGEDKRTIAIAVYEDKLRNLMQNPAQIFAPDFSATFFVLRIVAILFWFIIGLFITTIAPGAVGRSVARFQLSTLRVVGIGFLAVIISTIFIMLGLKMLPSVVSAIIGLMMVFLSLLAYVFGHAVLQVVAGKLIGKRILPETWQSESISLLIGTVILTVFLSAPYIWTFALLAVVSVSLGLVLTARSPKN
jgi:hypothetical protein